MTRRGLSKRRFRKQLFVALASIILLSFITLFSHHKFEESEISGNWSKHTLEVLTGIAEVKTNVFEIGTSIRGFAITNSPEMFKNYQSSSRAMGGTLSRLKNLVKDNKEQSALYKSVDQLIADLLAFYESSTVYMRNGNKKEIALRVKSGRGQALIDKIKFALDKMTVKERELLTQRLFEEKVDRETTDAINLTGSLVAILLVVYFIMMTYLEHSRGVEFQSELNENVQVQKALLNSASFALIAADTKGKITHINPFAENLMGFSAAEAIGQNMMGVHLPEEIQEMKTLLQNQYGVEIADGFDILKFRPERGIIETDQWTFRHKDGSFLPIRLTLSPLKDRDNKVYGYIGVAIDVTKQIESENRLIRAKEEALSGTKAKSEFLANMSHEIRTPMNAILGMAQLLKSTELSPEQDRYVSIFQTAGASLLSLINDILDLSKIESGHFDIEHEPFRLDNVIERAVAIIAVRAHEKRIELSVDIDEKLHNDFLGDANRLQQILLNFLGNAVKFTNEGEITLKVSPGLSHGIGPSEIIIDVIDTGIGMSFEQTTRLFQRFSQADSSITRKFGGTGLGLNISKKLIEMMGGSVSVQSALGIGSSFRISLRLEGVPNTSDELAAPEVIAGKSFLIVDDTQTNRLIVRKILEARKARVDEAESGKIALGMISQRKLQGLPYDMIILDSRMPEMSGFDVAETMKVNEQPSAPLLMMLTSDDVPGSHEKAKKLGLRAHLIKPVLPNILLESIRSAFSSPLLKEKALEAHAPSLPENLRILLVDDNPDNRVVIQSFLKNIKAEIVEANDGDEALALHESKTFDLILMDMQMPVRDGYSATMEIRRREASGTTPFTPILALSAFALKDEIDRSTEVGCNGHLTKPIFKPDLLKRIQDICQSEDVVISEEMFELAEGYIKIKIEEYPEYIKNLQDHNFATLQKFGHRVYGSGGSYGFTKMSEIGKRMEEHAREMELLKLSQDVVDLGVFLRNAKVSRASIIT